MGRIRQILAYLIVGGGTALFELVLFSFFYRVVGVNVVWSNIIAVLMATAANFFLNGTVAFRGSTNLARSIVLYSLLFVANTIFSTFVISAAASMHVKAEIAKLIAMACIVLWNFFLYRRVVFI